MNINGHGLAILADHDRRRQAHNTIVNDAWIRLAFAHDDRPRDCVGLEKRFQLCGLGVETNADDFQPLGMVEIVESVSIPRSRGGTTDRRSPRIRPPRPCPDTSTTPRRRRRALCLRPSPPGPRDSTAGRRPSGHCGELGQLGVVAGGKNLRNRGVGLAGELLVLTQFGQQAHRVR